MSNLDYSNGEYAAFQRHRARHAAWERTWKLGNVSANSYIRTEPHRRGVLWIGAIRERGSLLDLTFGWGGAGTSGYFYESCQITESEARSGLTAMTAGLSRAESVTLFFGGMAVELTDGGLRFPNLRAYQAQREWHLIVNDEGFTERLEGWVDGW